MNTKAALASLALLLNSLAASAGVDLGSPASGSPYEAYMRPVKQVLGSLETRKAGLDEVKKLMKQGRAFRYSFTEPYVAALPEVTARTRSGDCKAKSLWLCDQLDDRSARFVIGKATLRSKISHAWVMWNDGKQWWILDPTNTSRPIPADSVSKDEYIPFYSYDGRGCYRHAGLQYFAAAKIAGKVPVASKKR